MAKTSEEPPKAAPKASSTPKAPAKAPTPIKTSGPPSPQFLAFYRVVKVVAMLAGFVATLIGLMACIGALTDNGYARLLGALFVTFAVPLAIGDRLLPEGDAERSKGIITETMAVIWVVFGFVFATVANGGTRGLLTREGDRFQKSGYEVVARVVYFLAGVHADFPSPAPSVDASASASASAAPTASASATASPTVSASASAVPTATATASASVAPKTDLPEKTPAEIFKELAPAVVTIFVRGPNGEGGGTGFVIDKIGTIVTNHHVIDEARVLKIKTFGGVVYTDAELLEDDAAADLALIRIDPQKPSDGTAAELTVVTLGDSDKIQVGERAVSIGNPLGLEHTLTDGLVSARRMYEGRPWIQMSVPVSPGNSGGPVFNMHGEVIGITTAQLGGMFGRAQNLNLAVPVNEMKKLIKTEYPKKKRFGESANGRW
ncbi:MAG: trypsin-like peptidase domain-containing protein [Polyangiaceae bacterium]|nr:trypsin-like peptidase domain-containing protein [Polyangiaceae bacterium]